MPGARVTPAETPPAWSGGQKVGRRGWTRHPHARRQSSLPRHLINARMAGRRPKANASRSGGKFLPAARAPRCKHLAAADRRRAGAKAVTTLAHELAGLIGPLHGLVSEFQSSAQKSRASLDPKRGNADLAATADLTKRQAEKMNAALEAPLQGRAYAAPAPASQSWLLRKPTAPGARSHGARNRDSSAFCAGDRWY